MDQTQKTSPDDQSPIETSAGTTTPALPVGVQAERDAWRVFDELTPLVSAFEAGRLRNRLRFHLEQGWFVYGYQRKAAKESMEELGLVVRTLVSASERRDLQEAVVSPITALLEQIKSESHYDTYDGWTGADSDEDHTDEDFRWALEPVFGALAAITKSIEEKLDGTALLAFHLGETIDWGPRPRNVHCLYGRPRPTRDLAVQPSRWAWDAEENAYFWPPIRPGEIEPDTSWAHEVWRLWLELALCLEVPPEDLDLETEGPEESIVLRADQISERVKVALIEYQRDLEGKASHQVNKDHHAVNLEMCDPTTLLKSSTTEDGPKNSESADKTGRTDDGNMPTVDPPEASNRLPQIDFLDDERTIRYEGKTLLELEFHMYKAFRIIYEATLRNERITGNRIYCGRADRLLKKLPPQLKALIDCRSGRNGGYTLKAKPVVLEISST